MPVTPILELFCRLASRSWISSSSENNFTAELTYTKKIIIVITEKIGFTQPLSGRKRESRKLMAKVAIVGGHESSESL
jgi:hypothetical protein